ncbi:Transducin/WD40 repeat-like superfamily protein [Thalictrum thalictroides]|uniref:Transducin/WD40 repeat-like superfamily protein n=1 Tax=Thalictrum thalictroides TaxID=46969 RepID=A0A7J6VIF0_THATH|nr:Transducin/WD40 repeat-like superfamily protein [Thalictrum thalictroides]
MDKKSHVRLRVRVTASKRERELIPRTSLLRKFRDSEIFNSVKKLQRREIGGLRNICSGASSNAQEKFRNFQLQEEFDTYDPKAHLFLRLQFLKKRSKIIEIVAAKDVIFALAQSGLCAAFSRSSNTRICFLNITPDEVIRSLFYNKNNESLITVSVYASDHFSSLKCRTTPIEYIRRNQLDAGFPLFESESLKWPGFVEFDDVNGKVLTYSAQDGIYKVFDLKNYSFLYSISDKNVQEIKISPGIMLLIFHRAAGYVPLKILSIEDGTVLKSFHHLLHRNKKVDFIEQFNEKLLVKQENENLQILDVRNSELTSVSRTEFMTPSAFIFLYENHLFLTFRNRTVAVWNFRGELVTSFEDHLLWHPDCNTNNIYITSDQDLIISYCKAEEAPDEDGEFGSINMSNILTGKCIAKICSSDPNLRISPRGRMGGRSVIQSTVREALEDVTALFYDEDRNEIYTGNKQGLIHVWSN